MPSTEPTGAEPQDRAEAEKGGAGPLVYRYVRRGVTAIVGFTVLLVGIAMLVLPGPAVVVIPLGLGILAAEFAWARRLLARFKESGEKVIPKRWRKYFQTFGGLRRLRRVRRHRRPPS